jgi:sec-independent protein translocase protein TatA
MGGFSPMHMGLVLVIALLVFGPKKLPEIGRELGQAIREFKKASREVMDSFHDAADDRPPGTPAYGSYHSMPYEDTSYPQHKAAPALDAPPHAEASAVPAAPPPGTVDRAAPAVAGPVEAAAATPAAALTPAESRTHEPARDPAASERNR